MFGGLLCMVVLLGLLCWLWRIPEQRARCPECGGPTGFARGTARPIPCRGCLVARSTPPRASRARAGPVASDIAWDTGSDPIGGDAPADASEAGS